MCEKYNLSIYLCMVTWFLEYWFVSGKVHSFDLVLMWNNYLKTSFEIAQFCLGVQKDKCVGMMSAYFCPHLVFNSRYLIEFVCLNSNLIDSSDT